MTDIIATTQGQEINDGYIELFQITSPNTNKPVMYFHPGLNNNLDKIEFRDPDGTLRTYEPFPITLEGEKLEADGVTNRPVLTVANVTSLFSDALGDFEFEDLIGYRLIKRTTLESNLNTNPPIEFPQVCYIIDRISSENPTVVTFELAVPFDLENIKMPRRVVIGKYCAWLYQGAADGKGGCSWPKNSQKTFGDSTTVPMYFTDNDEPILSTTQLPSNATGWGTSTSYGIDAIVQRDGKYYKSLIEDNVGMRPEDDEGVWQLCQRYTSWSSGTSYSVGDFVKYDNVTVWKCVIAHTSSSSKVPEDLSKYWIRGDVCGKTLNSCRIRYAAIRGTNNVPKTETNSTVTLPFGAFPGSERFR